MKIKAFAYVNADANAFISADAEVDANADAYANANAFATDADASVDNRVDSWDGEEEV